MLVGEHGREHSPHGRQEAGMGEGGLGENKIHPRTHIQWSSAATSSFPEFTPKIAPTAGGQAFNVSLLGAILLIQTITNDPLFYFNSV
jgi:hypothetical protein